MKKIYFLFFAFLFITVANAQVITFQSNVLKTLLLSNGYARDNNGNAIVVDLNHNNEIEQSEALNVYRLAISGSDIYNLGGMQYFTNLKMFFCFNTQIANINMLSGLSNLEYLNCSDNDMPSITLSGMTHLAYFDCSSNNSLASLTISGAPALKELYAYDNFTTSLNLTGVNALETLSISRSNLSSIDATIYPALKKLYCSNSSELTSLNVNGLANLTDLDCSYSYQLPQLNLTGCTNIKNVNCSFDGSLTTLDFSPYTSLETIDCSNDALTALNVNSLIHLQKLYCSTNQLLNIDASGLTALLELKCFANQLSAINLTGLANLTKLECNNNMLPAITLTGLSHLTDLTCNNNVLTALNFTGLAALVNVNCDYNQLAAVSLNGLNNLRTFTAQNNGMTSFTANGGSALPLALDLGNNNLGNLDLSGIPNYTFACQSCHLTRLNLKNGGAISSLSIYDNFNLRNICVDDSELSYVQGVVSSAFFTNCTTSSYCTFVPGGTVYTVQGNNRLDSNNNGCDSNDINIGRVKFNITNGSVTGSQFCDTTGAYQIPLNAGSYTITPVLENPVYFNVSPASTTAAFPSQVSPLTRDFCLTANGVHTDLEVIIWPLNAARPGFNADYYIEYRNKGNNTRSGTVTLGFNDSALDLLGSSPAVSTQSLNQLAWNFTNLRPFESKGIFAHFAVNTPDDTPPVSSGFSLDYVAAITNAADETPEDNTFSFHQTVVNSHDPNDKTCLEGLTITPSMVGKDVHYMIRFENTGTASAVNVVVKDVIDTAKFDINSLVPLEGSHPFVTKVSEGNKVEFIFQNINLPFDDENNDGYVAFKIRTKPTLVLGNTFSNTANIYFDYNAPIITNTATTTIAALATHDFEMERYFRIYPNPANTILNIDSKKQIAVSSMSIYNALGQLVLIIPNAQQTTAIDVSNLKTGHYFIKIVSDKGTSNAKFIKN